MGLGKSSAIVLSAERIGIIHVVSVVSVWTHRLVFTAYIGQADESALQARDEKRAVYSFAECPTLKVDELEQKRGRSTKLIDIDGAYDSSVSGFVWYSTNGDGSDDHMYMAYMPII